MTCALLQVEPAESGPVLVLFVTRRSHVGGCCAEHRFNDDALVDVSANDVEDVAAGAGQQRGSGRVAPCVAGPGGTESSVPIAAVEEVRDSGCW